MSGRDFSRAFDGALQKKKKGQKEGQQPSATMATMSGEERALARVRAYLSGAADEDTVAYLVSIMAPADDLDVVEVVESLLEYKRESAGDAPPAAEEAQRKEAEAVVEEVKALLLGGGGAASGAAAASGNAACDDELRKIKDLLAQVKSADKAAEEQAAQSLSSASPAHASFGVNALAELCKSMSLTDVENATLGAILDDCGSVDAAALWITENDVTAFQDSLHSKQARDQQLQEDARANKEKIFSQYGLRPVSSSDMNLAATVSGGFPPTLSLIFGECR